MEEKCPGKAGFLLSQSGIPAGKNIPPCLFPLENLRWDLGNSSRPGKAGQFSSYNEDLNGPKVFVDYIRYLSITNLSYMSYLSYLSITWYFQPGLKFSYYMRFLAQAEKFIIIWRFQPGVTVNMHSLKNALPSTCLRGKKYSQVNIN